MVAFRLLFAAVWLMLTCSRVSCTSSRHNQRKTQDNDARTGSTAALTRAPPPTYDSLRRLFAGYSIHTWENGGYGYHRPIGHIGYPLERWAPIVGSTGDREQSMKAVLRGSPKGDRGGIGYRGSVK
ncbi:hypothetical protein JKP88DRAFT_350368 [Tribonema minus]|uniref:Secreted protein n=1 Tax=Tribonema minus TaxID=303371 RepID=A0A836CAV8_9STRA|nr:hypothetical protein JKP88DRAFT_350368 [Tribonema minus]